MSATRSSTHDPSARGPDPGCRRTQHSRGFLVALLASVVAFALPVSPAFGEGSVDINTGPDDTFRHALFMGSVANFPDSDQYTILYVYAEAGETIQMGNSVMGSPGTNIHVYAPGTNLERLTFPTDPPFANDVFDCNTGDPGSGAIPTGAAGRAQEQAGPLPNPGGYDPCEFTPSTTGIYPVMMVPRNAATNQPAQGTVALPTQADGAQIAIWDVTVRNAAGAVQSGRLFADQFVLYHEGASDAGGVRVFPYTRTGYEYQVDLFDHVGVGWTLRADDQGIVNRANGNRLFASFDCRLNTTDPVNNCTDTRAGFAGR
jgi:hypothetical protein